MGRGMLSRSAPVLRLLRGETGPLIVLAIACFCALLFYDVAEDLHEGESFAFDASILLALRGGTAQGAPIGPSWLPQVATEITALGSTSVLTLLTAITAGFLLITRKWRAALLLLVAVIGGTLLVTVMKGFMDRPRPDVVLHLVKVTNPSFPSGHAALSAATYLTIGAMLTRVSEQRRVKTYLMTCAVGISLLVGVTRIYLGVHWPSDVVAGWCLGSAWALLCWLIAYWLGRKGEIENAKERPGA
jgi:undecaprenyl-diphosphatase